MAHLQALTIALISMCINGMFIQPGNAQAKPCSLASCNRESNVVNYGFGNAIEDVDVDVGVCTAVFNQDDGCELPTGIETDKCNAQCAPKDFNLKTRSNRSGPFTVQTIRSCAITEDHCESCQRTSEHLYLFPDSKYQTRVDVGKCQGECNSSSNECFAVRTGAVAVEGPNGNVTVDTIEECGCRSTACYRADYFVSYTEQITSNVSGQTSRTEQLINVGRCVGDCDGVIIPGRCLPSPDNCLLRLSPSQALCVPISSTTHTFTDLNGDERSIAAVNECGCSTG